VSTPASAMSPTSIVEKSRLVRVASAGRSSLTSARRLPALDTLRAIAILSVVAFHFREVYPTDHTLPWLQPFLQFGAAGVDLFFVLSGYLIARLILSELRETGGLDARRFWRRRWMRTLPAYYAILTALVLADLVVTPDHAWQNFPAYWVFLPNYLTDLVNWRFSWCWSLCVEEWFYLLLPVLVLPLRWCRKGISPENVLRAIAVAAVLLSMTARLQMFWLQQSGAVDLHTAWWTIYWVTHYRLDGLAAGVFVATLPTLRSHGWAFLAAAALAVLLIQVKIDSAAVAAYDFQKFLMTALAFGVLVYVSVGDNPWARTNIAGARFIADLSYSLYLVHPILLKVVDRLSPAHPFAGQAALVPLTLAVAMLLRYGVELPFIKLRDRLAS
jgi:peptidoglycan/LPS O-acetylase OafA/YrhL